MPGSARAGEHVLGAEHVAVVVEKRLRPGRQVDRAQHDPHRPELTRLEIDGFLQKLMQFARRQERVFPPRGGTRLAQAGCPAHRERAGALA